MAERPRKTKGVNAVNRALTLLDVFMDGGVSLSLAELTRRTKLVKPTVLRLLLSLEHGGYVTRLGNGQYQLGAKVMQLGTVYRTHFALDAHVLPVLRHLADVTGETASFHVKEGNKRLCLFRAEFASSRQGVSLGRHGPPDGRHRIWPRIADLFCVGRANPSEKTRLPDIRRSRLCKPHPFQRRFSETRAGSSVR